MPIKRFSVENYRSFADPAEIELRPLTLVYGRNSAGKSALLRALPLLAESARESSTQPVPLISPLLHRAQFSDVRSRLTARGWMRFSLTFPATLGDVRFDFQVSDRLPGDQQVLESFTIAQGTRSLEATWNVASANVEHSIGYRDDATSVRGGTAGVLNPFIRPLSGAFVMPSQELTSLCVELRAALDRFGAGVQRIGATRTSPGRVLDRAPSRPTRMDADGGNALQLLALDAFTSQHGGPLFRRVQAWLVQHLAHRLRIEAVSGNPLFRVKLSPQNGSSEVDLCDTGEGLAQVLPVLVALAEVELQSTTSPQLLVLEQPELHLHLDAQHALTEMLCEVAKGPTPPTVLVETHSESVLVALQLMLAEGKIAPERVVVYVVRQDSRGFSFADRVTFDEKGYPSAAWPESMFQDVVRRARALDAKRFEGR